MCKLECQPDIIFPDNFIVFGSPECSIILNSFINYIPAFYFPFIPANNCTNMFFHPLYQYIPCDIMIQAVFEHPSRGLGMPYEHMPGDEKFILDSKINKLVG